jgi:imidazolonepropionase
MDKINADLVIGNASQLITCQGTVPKVGEVLSQLGIIEDGWLACREGRIVFIGNEKQFDETVSRLEDCREIDATGRIVLPGWIDPHTHLIFAGSRHEEFVQRLKGASYLEIAAAGGGIMSTVRSTRKASNAELERMGLLRLNAMIQRGITTCEVKSGYGLTLEDEIKMLEVAASLKEMHLIELIPTFLGAHTVPEEYKERRRGYIDLIIEEMLPEIKKRKLAEFVDIFCEKGAFTLDESKEILSTAAKLGFKLKIHAEQLSYQGGAELAAELGAISASHLDFISPDGINAMAGRKIAAEVMPASNFFMMSQKYPPVREMIEAGIPVALTTNFNPGSAMNESTPITMAMAAFLLKMSPEEVINAVTINAAYAIDRQQKIGSLEVGKQADIVIHNCSHYLYLFYHWGINHAAKVIKKGKEVLI